MKKILSKAKKAIAWFYQRKRNFGISVFLVSMGMQAFVPVLTPEQFKFIDVVGGLLAGWGWLHNVKNGIKK